MPNSLPDQYLTMICSDVLFFDAYILFLFNLCISCLEQDGLSKFIMLTFSSGFMETLHVPMQTESI